MVHFEIDFVLYQFNFYRMYLFLVRTPPKKFKPPFLVDQHPGIPKPSSELNRVQYINEPGKRTEPENQSSEATVGGRKLHKDDDFVSPYQPEYAAVVKAPPSVPGVAPHVSAVPAYSVPPHYPSLTSAQAPPSYPPQQERVVAAQNPSRAMIEDFAPSKPRVYILNFIILCVCF